MIAFNKFSNAAGILTRVLTLFDSIKQVAEWFITGANGNGPLNVPVPAKTQVGAGPVSQPQNAKRFNYTPVDVDDTELPPRMATPAAIV